MKLDGEDITQDHWEGLCRRCGQCCFEKNLDRHGRVVTTQIACRHLDVISRTCRVYHKRFSVGEDCLKLTPEVVRSASWLPADCAYVELVEKCHDD